MSDQEKAALIQKWADYPPSTRLWLGGVLLDTVLLGLSSPVELAVPVIRTLLGRRGVQTGAALGSLVSFLAGHAYFAAIAPRAASDDSTDHWTDPWMHHVLFSGAVALPAAGALLPATVVLRSRSPLWGLALWLPVRLAAGAVVAEQASRLDKRRKADLGGRPN
jgi:hypothetical protein